MSVIRTCLIPPRKTEVTKHPTRRMTTPPIFWHPKRQRYHSELLENKNLTIPMFEPYEMLKLKCWGLTTVSLIKLC